MKVIEMSNVDDGLSCPYDLNDPAQFMKWKWVLACHWYKEAFKLSYPGVYAFLMILKIKMTNIAMSLANLF